MIQTKIENKINEAQMNECIAQLPELQGSEPGASKLRARAIKTILKEAAIEPSFELVSAWVQEHPKSKYWFSPKATFKDDFEEFLIRNVANLPELEGSPKQIAWAKDLREKAVRAMLKIAADKQSCEIVFEWGRKYPASKYWIESRNGPMSAFEKFVIELEN